MGFPKVKLRDIRLIEITDPCWSGTMWFQWGMVNGYQTRVKNLATSRVMDLDRKWKAVFSV